MIFIYYDTGEKMMVRMKHQGNSIDTDGLSNSSVENQTFMKIRMAKEKKQIRSSKEQNKKEKNRKGEEQEIGR